MRSYLLTCSVMCLAVSLVHAEGERHMMEMFLDYPPATGILVTHIGHGTAADDANVDLGDVIVSYGGHATPTFEALAAARRKVGKAQVVRLGVFRMGSVVKLLISSRGIGVRGLAVTKGKRAPALPPATAVTFDFSVLDDAPRREWFAVSHAPGTPKVGWARSSLTKAGKALVLEREVAFDGGKAAGVKHHTVRVAFGAGAFPRVDEIRFSDPIQEWQAVGRRKLKKDKAAWHFSGKGPSRRLQSDQAPVPSRTLPGSLLGPLAALMPREKGACVHFRPIDEESGEFGFSAALVCVGREELSRDGDSRTAVWRFDWVERGGAIRGAYWVDAAGRVVRESHGGFLADLADRQTALAGVPERLLPRGR